MQQMDFVWVQFYNNGNCNVGQPGFLSSLQTWSKDLTSSGTAGPKLYIGAPACSSCAGSGYLSASALATQVKSAVGAKLPNLGGVMLWDGSEAEENSGFVATVKAAL